MVSNINRIPRQNVTHPAPSIYVTGTIDEIFLKNSPDAISTTQAITGYGSAGAFLTAAQSSASAVTTATPVVVTPGSTIAILDIPSLADIESIIYEEYPDPLTGVAKYNAIIKIRNSSINKDDVVGVDARIYNPNSINTYSFTTTQVATGSSVSTVVPKITWYNAQSRCNPFSGSYASTPAIVATGQYQSDGKDVPADSVSGASSARIKSVWRKTSAEALEAAKNSACEL